MDALYPIYVILHLCLASNTQVCLDEQTDSVQVFSEYDMRYGISPYYCMKYAPGVAIEYEKTHPKFRVKGSGCELKPIYKQPT